MTNQYIDTNKLTSNDISYLLETVPELIATAEMILSADIEDAVAANYLADVKETFEEIVSNLSD